MAGFQSKVAAFDSSYTPPVAGSNFTASPSALASVTFSERRTFTIDASDSSIRGATVLAAVNAMHTAIIAAVDSWITTTCGVNTSTKDVQYIARLCDVQLNSIWLDDATATYSVVLDIQVRVY